VGAAPCRDQAGGATGAASDRGEGAAPTVKRKGGGVAMQRKLLAETMIMAARIPGRQLDGRGKEGCILRARPARFVSSVIL